MSVTHHTVSVHIYKISILVKLQNYKKYLIVSGTFVPFVVKISVFYL